MSDIINGHHPHLLIMSYLSVIYMFAKLFELLIHRLVSPKCAVAWILGYMAALEYFATKRILRRYD